MSHQDAQKLRQQFLENEPFNELDSSVAARKCCGDALQNFDAQSHEAWLLHCPKGTDFQQLTGKRIKMPGKKYVGDLQVRAKNYSVPRSEAVGYVTSKGRYDLRKLHLTGYVVVSKRLNAKQPPTGAEEQVFPTVKTQQRYRFRIRHPLFGHDFKEVIQVPNEIKKSITKAYKQTVNANAKLWRTANYYDTRSKMLATTKTLSQKEYDDRQTAFTGNQPMYNYGSLSFHRNNFSQPESVELVDSADEAVPVKKGKNKKNQTSVLETGYELVEIKEEILDENDSPKKQKKNKSTAATNKPADLVVIKKQKNRKSIGGIHENGTENILDDIVEIKKEKVDPITETDVPTKRKKRKSNGEVLVNETGNTLDDVVEIKTEIEEVEIADSPPRKRKKLKTNA